MRDQFPSRLTSIYTTSMRGSLSVKMVESADDAVQVNGSSSKKELALMLMKEASGSGIRISKGGEITKGRRRA